MSIAKLNARAIKGLDATEVIVEVHVSGGLPAFSIVGLPDTEVKESRERVRSAIQMSGFNFPARRITVNLAPADLPKDSGGYDLPIALGILIAANLIKPGVDYAKYEFIGELALDGALRKVKGVLPMSISAKKNNRDLILPYDSKIEASLVGGVNIFPAKHLKQVINHIENTASLTPELELALPNMVYYLDELDFAQVKGQNLTKLALEIAASGRHSLLMIGNPGCGKSMLAQRLTTIMPKLTLDHALESATVYSLSSEGFSLDQWQVSPFRSPHHSSSRVAIVGGGSNIRPGEISLAHNGVLFLDELAEFDKKVLEVLREPLETRKINIARAKHKVVFPADFQLIAAMNPCPCGNFGHEQKICKCSSEQIARYVNRVSGPLIDRIDLVVNVPNLELSELKNLPDGESSQMIRKRVLSAREIQFKRQNKLNYELNNLEVAQYCALDDKSQNLLDQVVQKLGLSARGYYRLLKVARTIADLGQSAKIGYLHIASASQFKVTF